MSQSPTTMSALNPYRGIDLNDPMESYRLNALISRADYNLIRSVSPENGTIQTTVCLIVKTICDELRRTSNTTYNPTYFTNLVQRLTHLVAVGAISGPNESGGTSSVCPASESSATPRDIPCLTGPGGEGKGNGRKSRKTQRLS